MGDKAIRSIVKTFTWRFVATIITVFLVYLVTKEISLSIGVGILDLIYKLLFYYLHERTWNVVKWGKNA
jgi:uncharacterized membrane protein